MKDLPKKSLRKQLRAARGALPFAFRQHASKLALRQLIRSGQFLKGRRWGFYLPLDEEFDVLPLLNEALHRGKECFLPVTSNRMAKPLRFARLDGQHSVTRNRYGIVEPYSRQLMNVRWLDVLIMPLVGFDYQGHRLGMGGGYYDATLSYFRSRRKWRRPYLIGLAFECQRAASIPAEPWDIRLDAALTENGLTHFKRGNTS